MTKRNQFITIVVCVLAALTSPALARTKFQGYASRGGQTVITALTGASAKAMASYPVSQYDVFLPGTTTPATIYNDSAGTSPKVCPCTTNSTAAFLFYGDLPALDVRFSPVGVTPWTITVGTSGSILCDPTGFGAAGDGVTDDTVALQAAASICTELQILAGKNYLSTTVTVPATLKRISGGGTITQRTLAAQGLTVTSSTTGLTIDGITMAGIASTTAATPDNAIRVSQSSNVSILNCHFTGWRNAAVFVDRSTDIRVIGNTLTTGVSGVRLAGVQRAVIDGNVIRDPQTPATTFIVAIALDSVTGPGTGGYSFCPCSNNTDISITNNIVKSYVNSQALLVHDGSHLTITGNVFTDVLAGVSITIFATPDAVDDVTISGNTLIGTTTSGAASAGQGGISIGGVSAIYKATRLSVNGNVIDGFNRVDHTPPDVTTSSGSGCILFIYSDAIAFTGNTITGCRSVGIVMNNTSTNVNISNNSIVGTLLAPDGVTKAGIYLNGGASYTGVINANVIDGATWGMRFDISNPGIVVGPQFFSNTVSRFINASNVTVLTQLDGQLLNGSATFAALGTPANGTTIYCSDCTKATDPCVGGGSGVAAQRAAGAWRCP